jgi:hypothetical protein
MPVEAGTIEFNYTGDGVTTTFPFPARFLANTHLAVAVAGVEVSSGFAVVGAGLPAGGSVTFVAPPAVGIRVTILRRPPANQLTDFVNGQTVLEDTLDVGLDKLTMIAQYLLRQGLRTLRVPEFADEPTSNALLLPAPAARAGKLLGFDGSGGVVPVSAPGAGGSIINISNIVDASLAGRALMAADPAMRFVPSDAALRTPYVSRTGAIRFSSVMPDVRGDGSDDTAAIQAAIDSASANFGGEVVLPEGSFRISTLSIPSYVRVKGRGRWLTNLYATAWAASPMIAATGMYNGLQDLFVYNQQWTTLAGNSILSINNCVGGEFSKCSFQGGFDTVQMLGSACADNNFESNFVGGAIGRAQVYTGATAPGVNGANHIRGCRLNFDPTVGVITPSRFKGARLATTAYAVDDIVTQDGMYYSCVQAGVTGAVFPAKRWYFLDHNDGTAKWWLLGPTGLNAVRFDSNTSFMLVDNTDMTGTYSSCVQSANSFGGAAPLDVTVRGCYFHGPLSNGANIGAGHNFTIENCDMFVPSAPGQSYGIFFGAGSGHSAINNKSRSFNVGVYCGTDGVNVSGNRLAGGHVRGVEIGPNINKTRVIGNDLGSTVEFGANSIPVSLRAGTGANNIVALNSISGATFGIENLATGAGNVISDNT